MSYERMDNGVKVRADGKGDSWAMAHRCLGQSYNMQDFDAVFGMVAFGQNTAERMFAEYVPDNYANRRSLVRSFALVSMFDRKLNEGSAFSEENILSTAFYLHMCRLAGQQQSVKPRFFYVIGGDAAPWKMIGMDIDSGDRSGQEEVILKPTQQEFMRVWDSLGLVELRKELRRWVDPHRWSA